MVTHGWSFVQATTNQTEVLQRSFKKKQNPLIYLLIHQAQSRPLIHVAINLTAAIPCSMTSTNEYTIVKQCFVRQTLPDKVIWLSLILSMKTMKKWQRNPIWGDCHSNLNSLCSAQTRNLWSTVEFIHINWPAEIKKNHVKDLTTHQPSLPTIALACINWQHITVYAKKVTLLASFYLPFITKIEA